jgi:hypothetical protein
MFFKNGLGFYLILNIGKLYIIYSYLSSGVCNYTTPANKALLNYFDIQVENYSIEDYQTPKLRSFVKTFLQSIAFQQSFLLILIIISTTKQFI